MEKAFFPPEADEQGVNASIPLSVQFQLEQLQALQLGAFAGGLGDTTL